ncbi:hypothetical protein FRC03_003918 [Tulasnella sp. 419]|nr:hypothetical protein FRC03_003918 [Tulasnella sp. 419]
MPIHMLLNSTAGDILSEYYTHLAVGLVSAFFIRSWAMGPSNTRERDLHGRTVMMTGAFTPIGITVMTKLAERGAQIIALEPTISTQIMELAFVIRSTTSNDHIFVEECDITSPKSMKAFTSQFVKLTKGTGGAMEPPRVDALLFAHEYSHIGLFRSSKEKTRMDEDSLRRRRGLGTFFFINQMLPFLLKLPSDRDIRIINIVNPLYATATPTFDPLETPGTNNQKSVSIEEGRRSLRSIIFARHLQRVLDALGSSTPTSAPLPNPDEMAKDTIPKKPSNITSIVVTPGFTRAETIVPFFGASTRCPQFSALGAIII